MNTNTHKICLVEDDEIMGESLVDRFALEGFSCDWHRNAFDAETALATRDYLLVICDIRLPGMSGDALFAKLLANEVTLPPFVFVTGAGDIDTAVRLLKQGAHDYITKPFDLDALMTRIGSIASSTSGDATTAFGSSAAMRHVVSLLPRLAVSNSTVLITGESGVGKERIARTLHQMAGEHRPFVAVNCGALTESLLEAELFGYVKGAFTGAIRSKKGVFEQADGGTLFLDEIGDMSLAMQTRLLRAIQERSITRVGGETTIPVDLKLICATHRDLKDMVTAGTFREDLYYRVNVVQLRIPPLRERREDILWLARLFLSEIAGPNKKPPVLSATAEQALLQHAWPGNVRELRNTLERASLLTESPSISQEHLFEHPSPVTTSESDTKGSLRDHLDDCERDYIVRVLNACHWQIQNAADLLGISRKNLWEKMKRLAIEKTDKSGLDGPPQ